MNLANDGINLSGVRGKHQQGDFLKVLKKNMHFKAQLTTSNEKWIKNKRHDLCAQSFPCLNPYEKF